MSSRTPSARIREAQIAASREGLLEAGRTSPHSSNDEVNKVFDDDGEVVNQLDPANDPTTELSDRKRKRRMPRDIQEPQRRSWKAFFKPSKVCLFITAAVIVVLVASLGGL